MAKQVLKFAALDGTEFDTEAEADAYDAAKANEEVVEKYIKATDVDSNKASVLRRHLPQFLSFANDGVVPPKEVKKERKPRTPKEGAPADDKGKKAA